MSERVQQKALLHSIEWRWISGSTKANPDGVWGPIGHFDKSFTPSFRSYTAMTMSWSHTLYLFGGCGFNFNYARGDLWAFRQAHWSSSGEWAWMGGQVEEVNYLANYSSDNPYPGSRYGAVAWFVEPNVFIYGGNGYDESGKGLLSEIWTLDVTSCTWKWVKGSSLRNAMAYFGELGTASSSNSPGGRRFHNVICSKNELLIFGGDGLSATSSQGKLSDMWKFNHTTNEWTWINGPSIKNQRSSHGQSGEFASSNFPGGRERYAVMPSDTDLSYIFGGYGFGDSRENLAELWAFDTRMYQWAYIHGSAVSSDSYGNLGKFNASNHPGSRRELVGWADPNSSLVYVFGGRGLGYLGDFWAFNVTINMWAWAGGESVADASAKYGDSDWFSTSNAPGGRCETASSVDSEYGLMFLFGGKESVFYNQLWVTMGPMVLVGASPTITPSPTLSPTATPSASPSCSPSPSPSSTTSPSPSPSASPTTSPSPSPTLFPCVPGQYRSGSQCLHCPDGSISTTVNANSCLDCVAGSYTNADQSKCVVCEPGFECPFTNGTDRSPCLAGYNYSPGNSTKCRVHNCPAGYACPSTSNDTEIPCQFGTYAFGNDSECTPCPAAMACPNTDGKGMVHCVPGEFSSGGQSQCTKCAAGYQCPKTNGKMNAICSAGTYSTSGSTSCTQCPIGFACSTSGMPFPVPCPDGQFNNGTGLSSCTSCVFPQRCLSGNNCTMEYIGVACTTCSSDHFLIGVDCRKCLSVPLSAIPLVVLVVMLVAFIVKNGINMKKVAVLKIYVTQMQIFAITLDFAVDWPPALKQLGELFEGFNISFDAFSPACFIQGWNWASKFDVMVGTAFGTLACLEIGVVLLWFIRQRNAKEQHGKRIDAGLDMKLGKWMLSTQRIVFMIITVIYVPLTRLFVQSLMCTDVNGRSVLFHDISVSCDMRRLSSICLLALFTVVAPLAVVVTVARLSWIERKNARVDGYSSMSLNDRVNVFDQGRTQVAFGVLYESYDYKRGGVTRYFEAINMVRKALLIVVTTILAVESSALIQTIVVASISLVFFIIVVIERPYALYFGMAKRWRIDILNALDILCSCINVIAGVVAIIVALTASGTAVSVIVYILAGLQIMSVVAAISLKKRKRKAVVKNEDQSIQQLVDLRDLIAASLLDESYKEAAQYQVELARLRGRRIAELSRLIPILYSNFQDELAKKFETELVDYEPPAGVVESSHVELGDVGHHKSVSVDDLEAELSTLTKFISTGTVVDTDSAWLQVNELLTKVEDRYEQCKSLLQKSIEIESFRVAEDVASKIGRLHRIIFPGLISPLSETLSSVVRMVASDVDRRRRTSSLPRLRTRTRSLTSHGSSDLALDDTKGIVKTIHCFVEELGQEVESILQAIDEVANQRDGIAPEFFESAHLLVSGLQKRVDIARIDGTQLILRLIVAPFAERLALNEKSTSIAPDEPEIEINDDLVKSMWIQIRRRILFSCVKERLVPYKDDTDPGFMADPLPQVDGVEYVHGNGGNVIPDIDAFQSLVQQERMNRRMVAQASTLDDRNRLFSETKHRILHQIEMMQQAIAKAMDWYIARQEFQVVQVLCQQRQIVAKETETWNLGSH